MTILKPAPVSSTQFTWLSDRRMYVAEISDLGKGFSFGQVYDDACDIGFTLVSKTGDREIVFAVEVEATEDNEIKWWDFEPANRLHCGFNVRIFND